MAGKKLFVSNKDESPRMFESDFLDFFSRVHFSVPIIIYVPVVLGLMFRGWVHFDLSLWVLGSLFMAGVLFWTFSEYVLHRFVFHHEPVSDWGKRLHFMLHGVHHDYPNDHLRLVMPPSASLPLAVIFYFLYVLVMGEALAQPFMAGFVVGYLFYDITHYAIHHLQWNHPVFKAIQKRHLYHHFRDPEKGYSVSVLFWDDVFGTKGAVKPEKRQNPEL